MKKQITDMIFLHAIDVMNGVADENTYAERVGGNGSASHIITEVVLDARDAAISVIARDVDYYCKTNTDSLGDWIYNGDFSSNPTARELSAEWDDENA